MQMVELTFGKALLIIIWELRINRMFTFFDKIKVLEEYNQTLDKYLIKVLNRF